ncbi:hypothetical protein [uncultured Aquimarina sp.]|uniref:hypothetical protein n=1 Tax=uncultured Aquimarina sp. TaxID=575652 RepID=UPI002631F685|nr:hypothetical protein [uncultured Aquimarina sp.]
MILTIKDTTIGGDLLNEIEIAVQNERTTVKDIIIGRVAAEVKNYNDKLPEYFTGLVQPSEAEKTLNGFKLKTRKKIDAEQQAYIALEAFQQNGFFVLIDDQQAEDLDQEVLVAADTSVSFVKLTPLVGG